MAKEISLFTRGDYEYCARAHRGIRELMKENPVYKALRIREVEETREPEFTERFDYYTVSILCLGNVKKFEAHVGVGHDGIKTAVKRAFDEAFD